MWKTVHITRVVTKIKSYALFNECIFMTKFHILLINDLEVTLKICYIRIKICQSKKHSLYDSYSDGNWELDSNSEYIHVAKYNILLMKSVGT